MGSVHAYAALADGSKVIVTAYVRHSQSISQAKIRPWFAAEQSGTIICAHCTCMAGLGEACSHISALLFAAETHTRLVKNTACTSLPCGWLPPTLKNVTYKPVSDIDFTAPKTKKKKTEDQQVSPALSTSTIICPPTECEIKAFYEELKKSGKPSLLSIVPGYCDEYVVNSTDLPTPLSELFQWEFLKLSYTELISKCETVFSNLAVTVSQAKRVESLTRDQAKSKYWYRYRAGRVTASKLKAAAHTKLAQPSLSLIKVISYPECHKFNTPATKWGCEHERTAQEAYIRKAQEHHLNLTVSDSRLIIHPQYPYLGATPDGFIKCDCCGQGVLEIKCPYSCKRHFLRLVLSRLFALILHPKAYLC